MMVRKIVTIAVLLLPLMGNAQTQLRISGKVVPSPCVVLIDDMQVTLPDTQAHAMVDAGSGGEWVDFFIELHDCPTSVKSITTMFTGTPDTYDITVYKNTGEAKNVALQLAGRSSNYGNGTTMKADVNSLTHTALFPLSARIYSPIGNAQKGSFNSIVGLTFTYQ
jgi:minor fimbrial subunit